MFCAKCGGKFPDAIIVVGETLDNPNNSGLDNGTELSF